MKRNTLMHLIMLTILAASIPVYSMEQNNPKESNVILCTGDTCIQATITPYNDERDHDDVMKLLNENSFKNPQIPHEALGPFFSHKKETIDRPTGTGQIAPCNFVYTTYVLTLRRVDFQIISLAKTIRAKFPDFFHSRFHCSKIYFLF